jgi:hypothetical protein
MIAAQYLQLVPGLTPLEAGLWGGSRPWICSGLASDVCRTQGDAPGQRARYWTYRRGGWPYPYGRRRGILQPPSDRRGKRNVLFQVPLLLRISSSAQGLRNGLALRRLSAKRPPSSVALSASRCSALLQRSFIEPRLAQMPRGIPLQSGERSLRGIDAASGLSPGLGGGTALMSAARIAYQSAAAVTLSVSAGIMLLPATMSVTTFRHLKRGA